MSQRMKTAVVAVIALLLVFTLVVPAFAHAQLISSSPADDASVESADEVTLTFNENINPNFITVAVEGPDGDVADGEPTVSGAVLTQRIAPTTSGIHALAYRVVSADGHPVTGEITFTLTAVPAPAAEEPAEEPAPTEETPEATPEITEGATEVTAEETAPAEETTAEETTADETTAEETAAETTAVTEASTADGSDDGGFPWLLAGALFVGILALTLFLLRRSPQGVRGREH